MHGPGGHFHGMLYIISALLRCAGSGSPSSQTGKVVYGYVAEACQGSSGLCKDDPYHIGMGRPYLDSEGMSDNWQNNAVSWKFLSNTPSQCVSGRSFVLSLPVVDSVASNTSDSFCYLVCIKSKANTSMSFCSLRWQPPRMPTLYLT